MLHLSIIFYPWASPLFLFFPRLLLLPSNCLRLPQEHVDGSWCNKGNQLPCEFNVPCWLSLLAAIQRPRQEEITALLFAFSLLLVANSLFAALEKEWRGGWGKKWLHLLLLPLSSQLAVAPSGLWEISAKTENIGVCLGAEWSRRWATSPDWGWLPTCQSQLMGWWDMSAEERIADKSWLCGHGDEWKRWPFLSLHVKVRPWEKYVFLHILPTPVVSTVADKDTENYCLVSTLWSKST